MPDEPQTMSDERARASRPRCHARQAAACELASEWSPPTGISSLQHELAAARWHPPLPEGEPLLRHRHQHQQQRKQAEQEVERDRVGEDRHLAREQQRGGALQPLAQPGPGGPAAPRARHARSFAVRFWCVPSRSGGGILHERGCAGADARLPRAMDRLPTSIRRGARAATDYDAVRGAAARGLAPAAIVDDHLRAPPDRHRPRRRPAAGWPRRRRARHRRLQPTAIPALQRRAGRTSTPTCSPCAPRCREHGRRPAPSSGRAARRRRTPAPLRLVTSTYDPLRAPATPASTCAASGRPRVASCLPDFYGRGELGRRSHGLATGPPGSARWALDEPARRGAAGGARPARPRCPSDRRSPRINDVRLQAGLPLSSDPRLGLDAPRLLLQIPADWDKVCRAMRRCARVAGDRAAVARVLLRARLRRAGPRRDARGCERQLRAGADHSPPKAAGSDGSLLHSLHDPA